jgi:hypothetical protein
MSYYVVGALCAVYVVYALFTFLAIRIDRRRNTCPHCKKPLLDWTRDALPSGIARREHLYCETCDAYFLKTTLSPKPAPAPHHIKYARFQNGALRTRWLRQTQRGDIEAVQIVNPGRFQPYPKFLKCSPHEFQQLVDTAQFIERYRINAQTQPPPDPEKYHLISLVGKLSAIPAECQDPDFLAWLELLHKTDVPLHPLWRLELDGQPVADLYQVHLDWPWYLYEVVPLTGQNEINAALKTAVFFNDELDRLKYRLIESGELAELKPLCHVHGNHVLLRGPYMKAPR